MKTLLLASIILFSTPLLAANAYSPNVLMSCDNATQLIDLTNPEYSNLILSRRLSRDLYDNSLLKTTTVDSNRQTLVVARGLPNSIVLKEDEMNSRRLVVKGLVRQTISGGYATGGRGGVNLIRSGNRAVLEINNTKMTNSHAVAYWNVARIELTNCK